MQVQEMHNNSMRLTKDGVMSLDLDDPSARETALGSAWAAYRQAIGTRASR